MAAPPLPMAVPPTPNNLHDSIAEYSRLISTVYGEIPGNVSVKKSQTPSAHGSLAARTAQARNGSLNINALEYSAYDDQFVQSFKNTPVSSALLCTGNSVRVKSIMEMPIVHVDRVGEKYVDTNDEMEDRLFLSRLYNHLVPILQCHVLYAWNQFQQTNAQPIDAAVRTALESLHFQNHDKTVRGTSADMGWRIKWNDETTSLLRDEVKNNAYALKRYVSGKSVADLVSWWRSDNEIPCDEPGKQRSFDILQQVNFLLLGVVLLCSDMPLCLQL